MNFARLMDFKNNPMKQIKAPLTPREWAEKRLQFMLSTYVQEHGRKLESIDSDIEQCGFYLVEETQIEPPSNGQNTDVHDKDVMNIFFDVLDAINSLVPTPEKLDEPTTKVWTGYFTDKGERVNKGRAYRVNHIIYWIVEECVGDQRKFIALDGNGKKHELKNLFKYHKP